MTKRQSEIALPRALKFSFDVYMNALADDAKGWAAMREQVQDGDTRTLYAQFCSWSDLLLTLFDDPHDDVTCHTTSDTSLEGAGWAVFEETRYTTRFETSTAGYTVTLTRMFNGHMGYYEDSLDASFVQGTRSFRLSLDLFEGGPIKMTSDGLTPKTHDTVVDALGEALRSTGKNLPTE